MEFQLEKWLREQAGAYDMEIPLVDVADPKSDDQREWLLTNGLGSFASGSIWGANTRRYHGLFLAALEPPVRRTLLLSRIDEVLDSEALSTNYWVSGDVSPCGFESIVAFAPYPVPTWVYKTATGCLVKQVAMLPGKQEVTIGYTWCGNVPAQLSLHLLVNFRDFHSETTGHPDWQFQQTSNTDKLKVRAYGSAQELTVSFSRGLYRREPSWYWGYYWPREYERGLNYREDNFHPGSLEVNLEPGASVTIKAGLEDKLSTGTIRDVVRQVVQHQSNLWRFAGKHQNDEMKRLVLAADNFVVERHSTAGPSIIAGYPWFNDWGRDSMISLPGLTLATGRPQIARGILETFGHYLSQGMLPNNFPDSGMTPQYNTVDATLWWAWALLKYYQASKDMAFVKTQLPLLDEVVKWHSQGTRYGIKLDVSDGLIRAGELGVQLTWMDAKVGDYVVTPRGGKPVEVNALWFNFLKILESFHDTVTGDGLRFGELAVMAKQGFSKFWNREKGCLFDVIRDDGSADASVRPNQILALSLPYQLVSTEQAKSILGVVERELLTPFGLRTLSPNDPAYKGLYGSGMASANQYERDITYHQGTAWSWLIGAWVDARMRVYGSTTDNVHFIASHLTALRMHVLSEAGIGSISEIFDGNSPHKPRGCIAQAWSVAELLRVLTEYPQLQSE